MLAVVSVLTATKAPQKRIFLCSTPSVNNFMGFLSHYVLFAPVVCIYKETKVELLNEVPGDESVFLMYGFTWRFFLIFVYKTLYIVPPPNGCTPPDELESAPNAFSLAGCDSVLT